MNILITGITGLFGSFLAAEFSSLGKIHGIKRANSSKRLIEELDMAVHWFEADLADQQSLEEAMEGIDLVIHAAGLVSFNPRDSDALYQTNVKGTRNLVNAMIQVGIPKLIHVSSVAAIGRSSEIHRVDEKFKWTDSPLNTEYACSKYEAELEVWRGEQEGLQVLIVNPSIILGKISHQRSSTAIYDYVLEQKSYYPKGSVNYIDVRDAAKVSRILYEKQKWGQRYILSAGSVSYQSFFENMAHTFGKKAPSKALPDNLLRLAVWYAGFSRFLRISKIPLNKKTAMLSRLEIHYDNQKVKAETGYSFKSLAESFQWAK